MKNKKILNFLFTNLFKVGKNSKNKIAPKNINDTGKGISGLSVGFNLYRFFKKINPPFDKSKKIGSEANVHKKNIKIWDILNIFEFSSFNLSNILKKIIGKYCLLILIFVLLMDNLLKLPYVFL